MQLTDEQVVLLEEMDRLRSQLAYYSAHCLNLRIYHYVDALTDRVIRFVDNYRPSYMEAADRNLLPCDGVDGFDCHDPAVVHHLASEGDFCLAHFRFFEKHYGDSFEPYNFGNLANEN